MNLRHMMNMCLILTSGNEKKYKRSLCLIILNWDFICRSFNSKFILHESGYHKLIKNEYVISMRNM